MEIAKIGELGWLRAAMLTIRDRQMKALDDRALEDFFRRACAFLREFAWADIARLDDTRLLAGVKVAYAAARGHGRRWRTGLDAVDVTYRSWLAEHFTNHPNSLYC
jgi:hypothetical protein